MLKYKILSAFVLLGFVVNFFLNLNLNQNNNEVITDNDEAVSPNQIQTKPSSAKSTRNPAAENQRAIPQEKTVIKKGRLDQTNFDKPMPLAEPTPNEEVNSQFGYRAPAQINSNEIPFERNVIQTQAFSQPQIPKDTLPKQPSASESIIRDVSNEKKQISLTSKSITSASLANTATSLTNAPKTSSDAFPTPNTCSSNIAGGAFSYPIGIKLSCSNISTIKYCVAPDLGAGCCNPLTSGITYSSQIIIGRKNGNYCLSYYGQSASNGNSVVYQQSYVVNSLLPNLQVSHPQTFYQTTQLKGKSFVTSTDFGKVGYSIGQINLKAHDPGPAAENLDCEQIITNYVSLPTPNPIEVLTALDVSADNPTIQIEIPLRIDQLDYGNNFISSYIANANYVAPIYACSTTNVVLKDFEFFQEDLTFGDPGNNSIREFTGGFSSYGFFESDVTLYRGPAGVDTENKSGQKLAYGMFGIFY